MTLCWMNVCVEWSDVKSPTLNIKRGMEVALTSESHLHASPLTQLKVNTSLNIKSNRVQ